MKHRMLIIIILVLTLLIPLDAEASTTAVDRVHNARELDSSHQFSNTHLADILNILPDGHHDNFAGTQSSFLCRAEGWAADPDDRTIPLQIRIFSDGVEVAQSVADTFRQDLADAGVCQEGNCSFSVSLWGLIAPDVDHLISVQAQDAQTGEWSNLYDTPKTLNCFEGNSHVEGYHDAWDGVQNSFFCLAEGWVIDPNDPNLDLNVRILSDGLEVAQTIADRYRQDLDEGGVCPGGNCSFKVDLAGLISFGVDHSIAVQAQDPQSGEWVDLTNTPKTLNCVEPQAQTFVVNSIGDSGDVIPGNGVCETSTPGECTLRAAIMESNANPGADAINFNIPGAGPHTISPSYGFDSISDPVIIDATTQPGFDGTPIIELEGSQAGFGATGLFIFAGDSTIQGLVINRFEGNGIEIQGNGNNTIQGNFIGTDVTGTAALGNADDGVLLLAPNNTIGGTTPSARNIISGNQEQGIRMQGSEASGNIVQGNFVGLDSTGIAALGNGTDCCHSGVVLHLGASNNTIGGSEPGAGNVISGNTADGVSIFDVGTTGNLIQGNRIGTDKTGTIDVGNSANGILIAGGSASNQIGGTTAGVGNLISGNGEDGIVMIDAGTTSNVAQGNFIGTDVTGTTVLANDDKGVAIFTGAANNLIGGASIEARNVISGNGNNGVVIYGEGASSNTVQGNYIGTDVSGTLALSNTGYGIFIGSAAADNLIGGLTTGAGNLISGNGDHGIGIFDLGTTGTVVQGNYIGTDASGESALANSRSGVAIGTGAAANVVGGLATGAGNTIAFNNENGVLIYEGLENGILSNSIYANAGLGIDFADDGGTRNDLFDVDGGPNNLQNFPFLNLVKNTGKGTLVQGALLSTQNMTFHLEFFSSDVCDPSGYGEGQTYLGSVDVETNLTGHVIFKVTLPTVLPSRSYVTATATDLANNTSEFSPCAVVSP